MKIKQSKIYTGLQKLGSDLKPMTWKQRIDHLWTYYKEYLWLVAVAVIFLGGIIASFVNLGKQTVVNGMMVNIAIDQRGYDYLSTDYAEKIGAKPGKEVVSLEYTNFQSLENPTDSERNYYAAMTVIAEVSAKKLDYLILDETGMKFYITQDVYMDLRDFFTDQELAQLEDRLIYGQEEGSEDKWVMAVEITDLPFIQDNVTSEGKVYFALAGSTQRLEQCRQIWEYINQWQSETQ